MATEQKAVFSDFNLAKLTTSELSEHMRHTIQFGGCIAVFGRRGFGKTHISKASIKETGHRELYLNISVLERVDLGGYPKLMNTSEKEKYIRYLLPGFYECLIEGKTPVCLLLDEIDKADPSLFAPLLELVQFRHINGTALPNLHSIIMTGNLQAEGGARPSLPLLDRTEKYLLEVNVDQWMDWASKEGRIHPSVTAFIADNRDAIHGDVDPGDIYADASPRGWHNASKLLDEGEKSKWSAKVMTSKVAGCVGKAVGLKYDQYFHHYNDVLPMIEEILKDGKVPRRLETADPSKRMVTCMILGNRVARVIDTDSEKKIADVVSKVGKFYSAIDPEMALISTRSQIGAERAMKHDFLNHKDWANIFNRLLKHM